PIFDELGALADQAVAPAREWVVNRPGNRENLAALLGSQPSGDERAALNGGFDHQRADRQPADDPVTTWKMALERRCPGREFAHQRPRGSNGRSQLGVLSGVDDVQAGAAYRNRLTAGRERAAVAGGVDAEGESARDGQPAAGKVSGELVGVLAS